MKGDTKMVFLRAVAVGVTVGLLVWAACTALNRLVYGKEKPTFELDVNEEKRKRREAAERLIEDTEQKHLIFRCMLDCGMLQPDDDGHFGEKALKNFDWFWEHVKTEAER